MSMLEGSWINPFKGEQQDLVCLSTGKLATPEIEKDLLQPEALRERGRTRLLVRTGLSLTHLRRSSMTK